MSKPELITQIKDSGNLMKKKKEKGGKTWIKLYSLELVKGNAVGVPPSISLSRHPELDEVPSQLDAGETKGYFVHHKLDICVC